MAPKARTDRLRRRVRQRWARWSCQVVAFCWVGRLNIECTIGPDIIHVLVLFLAGVQLCLIFLVDDPLHVG